LDAYNTAYLTDGQSSLVWPITGYTYFIVNRKKHIGSCERRKKAMEYLYDFYHSETVRTIANKLNFATLPDFIRDIVVNKMVSEIYCNDGSLALKKHVVSTANFLTSTVPNSLLDTYLSVYKSVDATANFKAVSYSTSDSAWSAFAAAPDSYAGVLTVFPSQASKTANFDALDNTLTVPFAHHPVTPIYHLDSFTSSACATAAGMTSTESSAYRLRVTPAILAGIYTGAITYWDDALIKAANSKKAYSACLGSQPSNRILVVGLSKESDSNRIWSRFLAKNSATFQSTYSVPVDTGVTLIPFVGITQANQNQVSGGLGGKPNSNTVYDNTGTTGYVVSYLVDNNVLVDTTVTNYNYAFGYYDVFESTAPQATYAVYCNSADCSGASEPVDPTLLGKGLIACESDSSTALKGKNYVSYDLMISTAAGCYPIAATVDLSIYSVPGSACNTPVSAAYSMSQAAARVKFAAWLFNGTTVNQPVSSLLYQSATPDSISRAKSLTTVCDIKCGPKSLGYEYCGYRDCTWDAGDFIQTVLPCDPNSMKRKVVYTLKPGSTCLRGSPDKEPPSEGFEINCTYMDTASGIGIVSYILAAVGVFNCALIGILAFCLRKNKFMKRSQPIFIYVFIGGAILLNLVIISFVGENTDSSCMVRPWVFNIASTLMFAPLIMKLHRVDIIFRNPSLKKIVISDLTVFLQVLGLLGVDIVLLILWSAIPGQTPMLLEKDELYTGVLEDVKDTYCNTTLSGSIFEVLLFVWKACLIIFGVLKAIQTWRIPSDLSEAKFFAGAIYNITMFGGICYFISTFLSDNQQVGIGQFLRVLGVFFSVNVACLVIMVPKVLSIHGELLQRPPGPNTAQGTSIGGFLLETLSGKYAKVEDQTYRSAASQGVSTMERGDDAEKELPSSRRKPMSEDGPSVTMQTSSSTVAVSN